LRFALFVDNKWRREERALKTLPRAVILKRFATDLRVLLRAMGFGIGKGNSRGRSDKLFILERLCQTPGLAFHRMEPAGAERHGREARRVSELA
jgi:hypothetical protein